MSDDSEKRKTSLERNTRSKLKKVDYREENESEFQNSSEVGEDSDSSTDDKAVRGAVTATKLKQRKKPQMVPYEPIAIPFGEEDIEALLSYRELDGEEEVMVKFKYRSYHHVKWLSRSKVEADSVSSKNRFKKLKEQYLDNPEAFDEPFNQLYLEVDRILDEGEIDDDSSTDGVKVYLLVKWCGQPYEDSTWETLDFIQSYDPKALEVFSGRQDVPGTDYAVAKDRPKANTFVKLEESPLFKNENKLRDYQLEGLNWLTYCWYHRQSSIIADEMGLGKTVQSVAFLYHIYRTCHMRGPFLVVAPLSTIPHWEREFNNWTNLNVIVFHGSATSRNLIIDTEFYYKDSDNSRLSELYRFDVLITTYEVAYGSTQQLSPIRWQVGIFDEAHRLKNRTSKVLEALKSYKLDHRVLLTGTPLQNSVKELFSLLNFLEPTRFDSVTAFLEKYGDLKSSSEVTELQSILKPLMLRRFKEDVEKSIPSKEETIIEVQLTNQQKTWYRAILERNFAWIQRGGKDTQGPSLNNVMMELRKCCNHPFLIKGTEEKIMADYPNYDDQQYFETLVKSSGKLVLLDKLLPKLKESGHKVLIFSQMTKVLDLLGDYLSYRNYNYERIDGGIKGTDRQISIDRFSSSPDSFAFLLCTRAGGVGINLTAADTVIIFDSDWNPQNDLQAQARVHRIGQTRPVKIYRLLCANTYERQMFDRANLKLGLDKAVMQKMDGNSSENSSAGLSKKEVEDLLKLGAYGALLDDTESKKFYEEDIDAILQRRSTVVTYGAREQGSAFSKASFTTFDNDNVSIDDPQFWDKWAKDANVDSKFLVLKNSLILDEPRLRKPSNKFEFTERRKATPNSSTPTVNPAVANTTALSPSQLEVQLEVQPDSTNDQSDVDFGRWTQGEVQLLIVRLMAFGLSNWDKINRGFSPIRTLKDLVACSKCIISMCFATLQLKEPNVDYTSERKIIMKAFQCDDAEITEIFMNDLTEQFIVDVDEPYPDATPQQVSSYQGFVQELSSHLGSTTRKPKALVHRLRDIHILNNGMLVSDEDGKIHLFREDVTIPGSLPTWWTPLMDRDLILGTKKHGFNAYPAMRKDPELVFSTIAFNPMSTLARRRPLNAAGDEDDMEDMMEEEDENVVENNGSNPDVTNNETINTTNNNTNGDIDANGESTGLPNWPDGTMLRNRIKRFTRLFLRSLKPVKRINKPAVPLRDSVQQIRTAARSKHPKLTSNDSNGKQVQMDRITSIIADDNTKQTRLVIFDSPNGPILKLVDDVDSFVPSKPLSKLTDSPSALKSETSKPYNTNTGLQKITNYFAADQRDSNSTTYSNPEIKPDSNNTNDNDVPMDVIEDTDLGTNGVTATNGVKREFSEVQQLPNLDYYLQEEEDDDYDTEL